MAIPLEKAREVLKEYKNSGFNARVALPKLGYAESTANHDSKTIINSAIKRVVRDDMERLVASSNPMDTMFGYLGITAQDVASEFMKIVRQDKDMTNKLKALQPLLATQGIKWNEEKTLNAPTLNLTVKSNVSSGAVAQQSHQIESDSVAQYTLCDTPATSDESAEDLTPVSPFESGVVKEGESPVQNFGVLDTIDKVPEMLPEVKENNPPTPNATP